MKHAPTFEDDIHRYAFAQRFCWKKDVLDAAAKEGFGSQVISWVAKSVTLADIDHVAIKRAVKNGGYACPAEFFVMDFDKELPDKMFDTIVSFETIEHVSDPEFFVRNMAEHLKEGGYLVFSVPHLIANRLHKTLFDEEKIRALISKYFTLLELHHQDKRYLTNRPSYANVLSYVGVAQKCKSNSKT